MRGRVRVKPGGNAPSTDHHQINPEDSSNTDRTRTNTRKMDLAGLWQPDLLGTVTKHLRNISHQMEHSFKNKKLARS